LKDNIGSKEGLLESLVGFTVQGIVMRNSQRIEVRKKLSAIFTHFNPALIEVGKFVCDLIKLLANATEVKICFQNKTHATTEDPRQKWYSERGISQN
jgi:hypothetical protein